MSKRKKKGAAGASEYAEAIRRTPMFQPPASWVAGPGNHLTPLQFFAYTNEPRIDLDGFGAEDFGLVEEQCETVGKNGVELFTRFYNAPDLLPYITGDRSVPQRSLFIRYDRALAARGVLHEVQFIERDEAGRVGNRVLLTPTDHPLTPMSRDDMVRARNGYLSALLKKRSARQEDYLRLQRNGLELADRLVAQIKARQRNQARSTQPPRPAAPLFDNADGAAGNDALGAALANETPWTGPPGPATVSERSRGKNAKKAAEAVLETHRPESSGEHDEDTLAEELGGSTKLRPA